MLYRTFHIRVFVVFARCGNTLQVEWELCALEHCDLIVMLLCHGTLSPISLLELGLFAASRRLVVCCEDGFWRKGNVEVRACLMLVVLCCGRCD